ncbi:type IV secretion system protein VirB10 [Brevundimonas vesicularis]|uniref:type IV secretion system protein VirB10 n=1 Tax=Brevundimonas vesicularis TaxID=41276 RepID=UPI00387EBB6F
MLPNRNYLLTAGTQIPCILQTAMDTSTPGFVSCLISQDVYSDNGNVVLMERGTRVLGEYRGGLKRGQNRMFVLWNRAVTPKGVSINLASPAADTLGRAGMSGQVETFFWERFGGALLLSVVDDAVAVAANRYDDARNTVRQPSDAASVALENSVNIAPVLRKNQGTEVSIFAANDFDFSGVYRLALR